MYNCFFCILILNVAFLKANQHTPFVNNTHFEIDGEIVPRVVNGYPAQLGDIPYQIALKASLYGYRRRRRGKWNRRPIRTASKVYYTFCGAVIVAERKLITAAHCVARKRNIFEKLCNINRLATRQLSLVRAVAGNLRNQAREQTTDSIQNGQWRRIMNATYPSNYMFPQHDIAILFVYVRFRYSSYVGRIPYASTYIDYSGSCLVSGYGRISSTSTSDSLLKAQLPIIQRASCSRIHRRNMRDFVCVSSEISDVGQGDSGGPLVCQNTGDPNDKGGGVLVGIVSGHRYGCGSFFARVSSYYKYLERNTALQIYETNLSFALLPHILFYLLNNMFSLF